MSLLNPGKRGIYTLLSVILIIGIPGIVAYADSSDDTYYSLIDTQVTPDTCFVKYSGGSATFDLTTAADDDGLLCSIADTARDESTLLSSLSSIEFYRIFSSDASLSAVPAKFTVSTDLPVTSIVINLYDANSNVLGSVTLSDDDSDGVYEYVFSNLEIVQFDGATLFNVTVNVSEDSAVSEFIIDTKMYSSETVFTDDMVELIVLVGGILLLVLGTLALSFFDVSTPGKAFRSAGRSVRNITRRK